MLLHFFDQVMSLALEDFMNVLSTNKILRSKRWVFFYFSGIMFIAIQNMNFAKYILRLKMNTTDKDCCQVAKHVKIWRHGAKYNFAFFFTNLARNRHRAWSNFCLLCLAQTRSLNLLAHENLPLCILGASAIADTCKQVVHRLSTF